MPYIALMSGLIGALISAGLAYLVRLSLDKKAKSDAEKRLAYVHLVNVSALVAVYVVIRTVVKLVLEPLLPEDLKGRPDTYDASHALSVKLAEALQEIPPETLHKSADASSIVKMMRSLADSIKDSQLTPDQLSKLPRDVVVSYFYFLAYYGQLRQTLSQWADVFETGDRSRLLAHELHQQWIGISKCFKFADLLRTALIRYGAATPDEGEALLKQYIEHMKEALLSPWEHRLKIKAAMEVIIKTIKAPDAAKRDAPMELT